MCRTCPCCRTSSQQIRKLDYAVDAVCIRCCCALQPDLSFVPTRPARVKRKPVLPSMGPPSFGKADDPLAAEKRSMLRD
jgi:hypothetical protein